MTATRERRGNAYAVAELLKASIAGTESWKCGFWSKRYADRHGNPQQTSASAYSPDFRSAGLLDPKGRSENLMHHVNAVRKFFMQHGHSLHIVTEVIHIHGASFLGSDAKDSTVQKIMDQNVQLLFRNSMLQREHTDFVPARASTAPPIATKRRAKSTAKTKDAPGFAALESGCAISSWPPAAACRTSLLSCPSGRCRSRSTCWRPERSTRMFPWWSADACW